jgi:hypothetical protein
VDRFVRFRFTEICDVPRCKFGDKMQNKKEGETLKKKTFHLFGKMSFNLLEPNQLFPKK